MKPGLLNRLGLSLAVLWIRSLRPRFTDSPPLPSSGILILWHEHMLLCLPAFAKQNMRVLISQSRDGEWGARAAERLGYRAVRGSSSRGGSTALKRLARDLRSQGGWVAVVADGPRGPRRASKPGAAWLTRTTGLTPHVVSAASAAAFTLKGWDRCRVPFPFADVRLRVAPADPEAIDASMEANEARLRDFLSLAS